MILLGSGNKNLREEILVRSVGAQYVGMNSLSCKPGSARSLTYAAGLIRVLKDAHRTFEFDLVHFVDYSMNLLIYPLLKRSLRVPLVSDLHVQASTREIEPGLRSPLFRWVIYLLYEELALRFSDGIITPTQELQQLLATRYDRSIFSIPNCVSFQSGEESTDHRVPARPDKLRRELDRIPEHLVFFHANFFLDRAIREAVRLMAVVREVRARGYPVELWIAGPGSYRLGNLDEFTLNLGYVSNPFDYLAISDLVILPLKDRTLGLHSRLVDAMTAGKPVVASREACCGLLRYLQDSGIVVCDSLNGMVISTCALLDDPIKRKSLGERNSRLAKLLFSQQAVGLALERAYRAILEGMHTRNVLKPSAIQI